MKSSRGADHRPARSADAMVMARRGGSRYGSRAIGSCLANPRRNLFGRSWGPIRTAAVAMNFEKELAADSARLRHPARLSTWQEGDAAPKAKGKHGAAPAVLLLWGACQPMRFARTRLAGLVAGGGRQDFGRFAH